MLLKSLEIQGFKSFPDKTKLEFDRGLTAVVGPNGSGKSNISDAVRWVLGEQSSKTLRGEKMEDVIFNGTELRRPQGFAQVSLHIDNSDRGLMVDADEVTITRKYYRSGESDYLINGANVRLKDIHELFMDTGLGKYGYSMIGQGRIAEIVSAKSNERREIFEEASGISKFRYRRNEAQKRLDSAQENLLRLKDILAELEDRVGPLKAQSEKAKKYLEYSEKRKRLEISLWVNRLKASAVKMREHMDKLTICKNDYDKNEKELALLEEKTGSIFEEIQKCLAKADELRRQKEDAKALAAEHMSKTAVLANDIEHHTAGIADIEREIKENSTSASEIVELTKKKLAEIEEKKNIVNQTEATLQEKEEELLGLNLERDEQNSKAVQLTNEINEHTLKLTELKMTVLSSEEGISTREQRIETLKRSNAAKQEEVEKYKKELSEVNDGLEAIEEKGKELSNSIEGYELKLNSRRKKLSEVEKKYSEIDFKIKEKLQKAELLSDLEQNMEGFAYSVKSVITASKKGMLKGILGTVSQLVSVEEKYSVAIETALGSAMQNIIVENESNAKAAISFLVEEKAGRATFLPITSVKGNVLNENGLDSFAGYIALASELVRADDKFTGIINSLLGRTVVAEDLNAAADIAKKFGYRFKIVTLDGQVVNAGGSFTGGSRNKNQGILSRKNEIERLKGEAEKLKEEKQEIGKELEKIKEETARLDAQVVAISSELVVLSEDKIRFEGEKKRLEHVISGLVTSMEEENKEIAQAQNQIEDFIKRKEEAQKLIEESQAAINEKQKMLSGIEGFRMGLNAKREELSGVISGLKIRRMEALKDIENAEQYIEELKHRTEDASSKSAELLFKKKELEDKIEALKAEIENLKLSAAELEKRAEDIQLEIEKTNALRNEMEASTSGIRASQKELTDAREALARELARLEEQKLSMEREVENIVNNMWEEYSLTRSEAEELAEDIEDPAAATRELNELKNRIKALGSVNVDAIEEYKEVSERYEFLSAQVADAEKSRDELIKLIADLTKQMQTIFTENFYLINENFKRIFTELFGGGKASLKLTDESDVLESGIEIYVQPPGKIINNLSSLSGGEQAFVAIAIYFAILKVRPAPFCILDEIEAALDEANVVKYAKYLRNISDKTQFILISHRRGTMEEADVLYGVTMQEKGVSKLLKLNVSEIEEKLGMKS